jgi:hypothetical protein
VLGDTVNLQLIYTLADDLIKPAEYVQSRYRCENQIGFGEYSDSVFLLKSGVPDAPPKPTYVQSDSTSITVHLYDSPNINGSPITEYKIVRDDGDYASDDLAIEETTYDGHSVQFTIMNLTPGSIYRVASIAVNAEGSSEQSDYVIIGAGSLPEPTT